MDIYNEVVIDRDYSFPQKEFILIGACLPRTGTLSLKLALRQLLGAKCAHMADVTLSKDARALVDIYSGRASDREFRDFFLNGGYAAGVDAPFCFHVEQALRAFPGCKVLLTGRDMHAWRDSVFETTYKIHENMLRIPVNLFTGWNFLRKISLLNPYIVRRDTQLFRMHESIRTGSYERFYEDYRKSIKNIVPADRLLEYNIRDGWKPLCDFLGLPAPDSTFPHRNDRSAFKKIVLLQTVICWSFLAASLYFLITFISFKW